MRRLHGIILLALFAAALSACGATAPAAPAASTAPTATAATAAEGGAKPLRKVTLAMSYIPNVQFSPYYVAQDKGYYAQEGLDVAFDYNFENDVVARTAQGSADFAMASGLSVLLARGQDLPVATVMTLYQQFPVVFFSKSSQNIKTVADMRGKSVGLPGRFGASYYGLLAMLYANKIPESDLNIQEIGFTQAQALLEDKVQVATGYAMNEPIALREQGQQIDVIRVADSFALASDGVVASEKLIESEPDVVRAFVRATLKGLSDALANPDEAFEISMKQIPEIKTDEQRKFQRTQLQETLPYWQSDVTKQQGLGYTDPDVMQKTYTFLRESELLKRDVDVTTAFSNAFPNFNSMAKEPINAILFDLDNTLYPLSVGLTKAIDERMTAYVQRHKGVSLEEALALRQRYMENHGSTLRGLQMTDWVDPDDYLHDVHAVAYESFLALDEALDRGLAALGGVRKAIFTNAPLEHAERVLQLLGIARHFEQIFDIRFVDFRAKPDPYAYERALEALGAEPARTLLVEDTARNLPPAHTLSLTTIFIGEAPVANADHTAPNILEALEIVKGLVAHQ